MPDASTDRILPAAVLYRLTRAFEAGLETRLETLRSALHELGADSAAGTRSEFLHAAHSLKGTASAYHATELIGPATALTELGREWQGGETITRQRLTSASHHLTALSHAVDAYRRRLKREET